MEQKNLLPPIKAIFNQNHLEIKKNLVPLTRPPLVGWRKR